jgi:hypothetical protein
MIYSHEDNHILVKALKKKGWVIFDIMFAYPSQRNGKDSGWQVECATSYDTIYYQSHRVINGIYLGRTIKVSLDTIRSDDFPSNIK